MRFPVPTSLLRWSVLAVLGVLVGASEARAFDPVACSGGVIDPGPPTVEFTCSVSGAVGAITGLDLQTVASITYGPNEICWTLISPSSTSSYLGCGRRNTVVTSLTALTIS